MNCLLMLLYKGWEKIEMKLYYELCCVCFRSLGVHVSKVRSLILDAWEPEQIKVQMQHLIFFK